MSKEKELTLEEQLKVAQDENKKLAADLAKANEALAGKDDLIKGLNEELVNSGEENEKASKRPYIKHGKKTYELRIPKFVFRYEGNNLKVDEALLKSDKDLVAALVKSGSNALIEKGGN